MSRQPVTISLKPVEEMSRIIILLLLGGTFVFVFFAQRPVLASSSPSCTYVYYATGVTQTLTLTHFVVPKGCVLVTDSYTEDLNGVSWDQGGVFAFQSGTYSGFLTNGEYDIVPIHDPYKSPKQVFCDRLQEVTYNQYALNAVGPLPEWGLSKRRLLQQGHC